MRMVNTELDRLQQQRLENRPDLELELYALHGRVQGWNQSLANRDLDPRVRLAIETEWAAAAARAEKITETLAANDRRQERAEDAVNEDAVLERLQRLPDILAANNPTRGNLELSLHIDKIICHSDGRVETRVCKLGALPEVAELLLELNSSVESTAAEPAAAANGQAGGRKKGPRRRGRLRHDEGDLAGGDELRDVTEFAADTQRFGALGPEWFWSETYQIPEKRSWVEENADAVWARHQEIQRETGKEPSLRVLASEFGKSRPTIKTAIDIATGKRTKAEKSRRKFTPPLDESSRGEVIRLFDEEGLEQKEIAERLDIHRNTVARFLNARDEERGEKRPDGRRRGRRRSK
jgi:hypothetical protein